MAQVWKRDNIAESGNSEDNFTAFRKIGYNADDVTTFTTAEAEAILNRAGKSVEDYEFDNRGQLSLSRNETEVLLVEAGYERVGDTDEVSFNGSR